MNRQNTREVCPSSINFSAESDDPSYAARSPGESPFGVELDLTASLAWHPGTAPPALVDLFRTALDEASWESFSRGSAIRRAAREGFARNVAAMDALHALRQSFLKLWDGVEAALVRAAGEPQALVPALRQAVAAGDPGVPLSNVRTLQDIAADRLGARRFALSLFGVFAGLALLLGAVGIYGVMSYSVAQRARELGIRMALGASRGSVLRMVLGESARLTVPGVILGLLGAMASARVLGSLLFEVSPLDLWTYASVAAVLALVTVAATWLPAWRATRVDPMTGMRAE